MMTMAMKTTIDAPRCRRAGCCNRWIGQLIRLRYLNILRIVHSDVDAVEPPDYIVEAVGPFRRLAEARVSSINEMFIPRFHVTTGGELGQAPQKVDGSDSGQTALAIGQSFLDFTDQA